MKSLRVVLPVIVSMLAVVTLQAQTADEIVNKHIEAMGGKEKLNAIKTIYTEFDMDVMGNQMPGISYMIAGKGYRSEIDFNGQKIIQCYTDKSGWMINPMMGQTSPEPLPEDQVKASQDQLNPGGPLFDYAAKGNTVELLGTESLNGATAYKLKLKTKEGNESTLWLDSTTYYMVKLTSKIPMGGQQVETGIVLSNYKKTDYGNVMPGSTEITLPQGMNLVITSKKIEINKEIDPKLFEMQK